MMIMLLSTAAASASAQGLNTEITVEREVVPLQLSATRLPLVPSLSLPAVAPINLTASDRYESTTVPPYLSQLEPAAYATSQQRNPYRGYLDAGYFPAYNLGVSAGYRITPAAATDIDIFGQFNGHSYTGHLDGGNTDADRASLHRNTFTIGSRLTHRLGRQSRLTAHFGYSISGWNAPYLTMSQPPADAEADWTPETVTASESINANRINLGATWSSSIGSTDLSATAGYEFFKFGGIDKAMTENSGRIGATAMWHYNDVSAWGGDFDLRLTGDSPAGITKGVIRLAPHYTYSSRQFNARLGVVLDLAAGNRSYGTPSRTDPVLAPDLMLSWTPSGSFAIWGRFSGELAANSVASVYDYTPYCDPTAAYGFSRIPVNVDAGITIGPWRGAALELRGGYSSAENWLMPDPSEPYAFTPRDVDGLHYGATLSYSYRRYLDLKVRYDGASHSSDHGYYLWRDGARSEFGAEIGTSPIEPLTLRLSYTYREGRRQGTEVDLGVISDLGVSAHYDINDRIGVFARAENLLNRHYYTTMNIPGQGVRGLLGITYKFK